MEKKSIALKFNGVILAIGVIPMLLASIIIGVVLFNFMETKIREGIESDLLIASDQVVEYFKYDLITNGTVNYDEYSDHKYIESLQDEGIELTLFEDNYRLITSLKKDDGTYNEKTQGQPQIYVSVKEGNIHIQDNVKICGVKYYVCYRPIYDANGDFWGMAFAGENMEKVNSAIMSARINAVIVILVLTIVLGAIVWFVGTKLSKALMVVMDGINTLALGKLNADFDCKSGISEIQNLAACGQTLQIQLLNSVGGAMSTAAELGVAVENVDNL